MDVINAAVFCLIVTILIENCVCQTHTTTDSTVQSTSDYSTVLPTTDYSTVLPTTALYNVDENNVTWHPHSAENAVVQCEEGYKLAFTVLDSNIDGANNEFVNITSGRVNESLLITYNVTSKPSFLYHTNRLFVFFYGSSEASNVTVIFSRHGELPTTTTTEMTASTRYVPPIDTNSSYDLTVYLTGKDPEVYRDEKEVDNLKYMILQMVLEYISIQSFTVVDDITTDNIKILKLVRCTKEWPTCLPCTKVKFAIPIAIEDNPNPIWSGYQLNSYHLQIMWSRYSKEYLVNTSDCSKPPMNNWLTWQIIIVGGCLVILCALFIGMYYLSTKISKNAAAKKMRKTSDGQTIFQSEENSSKFNLSNHYLQETPSLFENTYPMYNPGIGSTNDAYEGYPDDTLKDTSDHESSESEIEESGA